MVRIDDARMKAFRRTRKRVNARLVKAFRAGRLTAELQRMEREARAALGNGHSTRRKRAKRA